MSRDRWSNPDPGPGEGIGFVIEEHGDGLYLVPVGSIRLGLPTSAGDAEARAEAERRLVQLGAGLVAELDRERFDLDAAAEARAAWAPAWIDAQADALAVPWGPLVPGWAPELAQAADLAELPAVWLNPPFGPACGGKDRWIARAVEQAATGLAVALYLPSYADPPVAQLDGLALARCSIVGRVKHTPPPGLAGAGERPDRHGHAIYLLGPPSATFAGPLLSAWDWQARAFVGRAPVPRSAISRSATAAPGDP